MPVEVVVLLRHRDALSRRVLEIGCGAGRVLGYLVAIGGEVHGIDISPPMVEFCRRRYPEAEVRVGDLRAFADLDDRSAAVDRPWDAIVAFDSVLDVLDDGERRRVLSGLRTLIAPGGVLMFSSHNLSHVDASADADRGSQALGLLTELLDHPPAKIARAVARLPRMIRNRRALAPLQRQADDHAILNDEAHDWGLLLYYIRREDQERQLVELGYEPVECLDTEGHVLAAGEPGAAHPWLHYIARPLPG